MLKDQVLLHERTLSPAPTVHLDTVIREERKKNIIMIKLSTTSKILIIIIVKSQGKKEGKPATIFLLLFS